MGSVICISCTLHLNKLKRALFRHYRQNKADQVEDMDGQPHGPGNKAGEANFTYFQNGEGATYRGEISFVVITEWRSSLFLPGNALSDYRSDVATCLHGYRSDPRERLPILCSTGSITNDKNVRVPGEGKILQYFNPAAAIYFGLQPLTGRRGFDTCAPDHGFRCDVRTCNPDAVLIDGFDGSSCSNLNA